MSPPPPDAVISASGWHELGAVEQAAAIRRSEVSPVELVCHHLDRIAEGSDRVGAFVTVTAEAARDAARDCEIRLREGGALPPFLGVPVAIKDLVPVAGVPMCFGSRAIEPFVPDADADVVAAFRRAGFVVVGTTSTPEFGLAAYTEPDGAPPARSPLDLTRSAGGSSGGSAAAVAAGLVPVAHGTDGAGSVRTPAACCGLVGLKPSRGRISNAPHPDDGPRLGVQGLLARTVADVAGVFGAVTEPVRTLDVTGLRIARHREPLLADVELHPDVVAAYDKATALLEEMGLAVVEITAPIRREDVVPSIEAVWSAGAAAIPIPADGEDLLTPLARWLRARGRAVDDRARDAAVARLQAASEAALAATEAYDVLLVPTLATPPPLVGAMRDDDDPEADFHAQERFNPFSAAYNMTGQPAVTLPVHRTADGLSIGVQLVGRPAGEAQILSLAARLEEAVS